MIILDTNVVSEPMAKRPSEQVMDWLDQQSEPMLFLATPVIAELSSGANEFVRRTGSRRYLTMLERLLIEYEGKILDLRVDDAIEFGKVNAARNALGRPIKPLDAMIAAICISHGATLATRNVRDFAGLDLKLVNPFEAGA